MNRLSSLAAATLCLTVLFHCFECKGESADLRLNTIVIDAGHGGKDAGTVSSDKKTYEKTLTLKLSKKFAEKVRAAYPEMKVILTREKDVFVPLMDRTAIASEVGAQLFVSIHINAAAKSKTANGFSAYILGPSKKSKYDSYDVNLEVLQRENSVIFLEDDYSTKYQGYDPNSPESEIFMQLMQNAFREQSLAFAESVSRNMDHGPFRKNWGVMQANFCVLRQASMPAVLLEYGFMSNPDDLSTLRKEESLNRIVNHLFDAFVTYKKNYDESVSIEEGTPAKKETAVQVKTTDQKTAQTKASKETAVQAGGDPSTEVPVFYGVQVLVSSKEISPSDKYFRGYDMICIKVGKVYKYILSPQENPEEVKTFHKKIKTYYPESFIVKVEGENISIFR